MKASASKDSKVNRVNSSSAKQDLYQEVTDTIVKALGEGIANPENWRCPWHGGNGLPVNHATGKAYQGVNVLLLCIAEHVKGYSSPRWMTFAQGKALGGNVRKGEKGTPIVYYNFVNRVNSEGKEESFPILKSWTVFNLAQFDGIEVNKVNSVNTSERIEACEELISSSKAEVQYGFDKACYVPALDIVKLPKFEQFNDAGGYYSTVFHELAHWTGNAKRLNRDLSGRFGSASYAMEELVAELASAYLCAEFKIEGQLQHADYIADWINVLKGDKYAIFTASKHAQLAADYLSPST